VGRDASSAFSAKIMDNNLHKDLPEESLEIYFYKDNDGNEKITIWLIT